MMPVSRRFLPPMPLLCAFEAAARHHSFTAAAQELNLTQGAVSRQIRALEELVGASLFLRTRQRVSLTPAGATFATEVREALARIAAATLGMKANPGGGTLDLAILPTFGVRWLAPRLPRFQRAHPGITINLTTRLAPFDFQGESLDAAIHFGRADWPGAKTALLMEEVVIPACSPDLRAAHAFAAPEDLLAAPLLHLTSRPDAWEHWFATCGVSHPPLTGMLLDQFALIARAAAAGLGLALLPAFLIRDELASGDLVAALDRPVVSRGAYHLAWPPSRDGHAPLAAFRTWLLEEARGNVARSP